MNNLLALTGVFLLLLVSLPATAADACTDCHNERETRTHFRHANAEMTCADCHGASEDHLGKSSSPVDIVFRSETVTEKNQPCMACHDNAGRMHWSSSVHEKADVACTDCHAGHGQRDPMLDKKTEQAICLDCHAEVKLDLRQRSRHPIKELKTTCSDCHASHGSTGQTGELIHASTVEQCVSCHKEKRGPFLFEHEPVTEDCVLCHKPHGSAQPAMLVARPPFLCQTCHMPSDHPSRLGDGSRLTAADSNLIGASCMNCHGAIHGSNHPSGARLIK